MISNKQTVQALVQFCKMKELNEWVISPGSRNAPITLTVGNDDYFKCEVIVDERSAAFIALGMSLQSKRATVICCTSGTASLNYAPAIAEAYYQKIPMLIVTADRPSKWIDNGEGQCINQKNVYANFILNSFHLEDDCEEIEIQKTFNEIYKLLNSDLKGPIHLNLAFEEPLYEVAQDVRMNLSITLEENERQESGLAHLKSDWDSFSRIMILCGQLPLDENLAYHLKELNADSRIIVLTETSSNLSDFHYVNCIDRTLARVSKSEQFHPELVVTIGGAIISKKIKAYLRNVDSLNHWQISPDRSKVDVFGCLSEVVNAENYKVIQQFSNWAQLEQSSTFKSSWLQASFLAKEKADQFLETCPWSDLKVFEILHQTMPESICLHMGNSSPVRYLQLFNPIESIDYLSNRGVSGIDGCISTALGYSIKSDKLNLLIVGDLSFVYDINSFWNKISKSNLRVIVINNGGGGIFRIIPGPESTSCVDDYFEVGNSANIQMLCSAHNVSYYAANNADSLENELTNFYAGNKYGVASVLEINTPSLKNAKVLSEFFSFLNL